MANSRRNVSDGWLRIPVGGVPGNPSAFTSIREAIRDLAEDVQRINVSTTATSASAQTNVTNIVNAASPTSGTVTSVGLNLPGIFTVSGSPVTTVGTLSATLATQTSGTVFAGPTGSLTATKGPGYIISYITVTGSPAVGNYTLSITNDNIAFGITLRDANNNIIGTPYYAGGAAPIDYTAGGLYFYFTYDPFSAAPQSQGLTVSVTTSTGTPTFRALTSEDIPSLATTKITTGTFSVVRGGTGLSTIAAFTLPYASATDTFTTLSPNTTTTRKFLRMVGDGTNGAAPAWDTLTAGDIPSLSGTYLPLVGGTLTGQLIVNTTATGVQYPINVTTTIAGSAAVNVTNTSADASANVRFILNNDANNNAGFQLRSSTHATEPNDAVLYSGSGSINLYTGGNPRVKITSGGQVRIGPRSDSSASATSALELSAADGTATSTILRAFGNTQPSYSTWTANGTFASPSATQTDNTIMAISGRGYGATGFAAGSRVIIYGRAAENWTDAAQGTYLTFFTTATGTVTPLEKMRLSADGKLGINVTSPQAKLHLSDASTALNGSLFSALDQLILNNDGSGSNPAAIRLVSSNSVGLAENTSGVVVFLGTRGTNAVPAATETIDRLGRVIFQGYTGTGRYTSASIQVFQETSVTNSRVPAYITFYTASTTQDQTERMRITSIGEAVLGSGEATGTTLGGTLRAPDRTGTDVAGTNLTISAGNGTGTGGSGAILFTTAPTSTTGSTANTRTERMRIMPNGRVGIGVTNPTSTLTVKTASVAGFFGIEVEDYTQTTGVYIQSVSGGNYRGISANASYYNSSLYRSDDTVGSLINLHGGEIKFYTDTGLTANVDYTPSERMRITSAGNVGIGVTPAQKLDVGGAIAISGTTVIDSTRRVRASMFAGIDIDNNTANVQWYKIGRLAGYSTTVTIQVNAKNSYNDGNEGGLHTAVFKQGNADNELGGFQWTVTSAPAANTSTFRWLRISDGNYDLYYVAGAYTRGELFILDGLGFTEQFAATTDPTGTTELQKLFKTFDPVNFQGGVTTTTISGTTITGTSYTVGATTVIDTSRNLTNIGTIASGNVTINSSGGSGVLSLGGPASPGTSVFIQLYRAGTATTRDAYIGYSASTNLDITNEIASGNIVLAPGSGGFVRFNGSGLFMSGTQFMDSSRNLSNIGTIASGAITATAEIASTNTSLASFRADTYGTGSAGSIVYGRKARGTSASATATLANDDIMSMGAVGHDGTAFTGIYSGIVKITAGGNWSSTSYPTLISFGVTPVNSTTRSEAMRIDPTGNLLVGLTSNNANGGVLQLKSGITFPAARVASTDVNTLDDYEEGTFTPTLTSTGATFTYSAQTGKYTIVGNQIFLYARIALSALSGGTAGNAVTLTGLPAAAASQNVTNLQPGGVVIWSTSATNLISIPAKILPNTQTVTLYKVTAAGTTSMTALTYGDLAATTVLELTISYYVA